MAAIHSPSPTGAPIAAGLSLAEALEHRQKTGKPVRVGLIGAGQMGTDIVVQVAQMQGIEIAAVADIAPDRVSQAAALAGQEVDIVSDNAGLEAAGRRGRIAATNSLDLICRSPAIDVIIDATGNPEAGSRVALTAIAARKHIVMMNVEADITIGSYLAVEAAKAGVVYTLGAGDEPAAAMELINFVRAMGYPVVAAGKGKNNPFRIDAVPADYVEEATRRNMNPRMLVEFVDGSKTMVEMVAIANACGFVPDIPGMHGPAAPRAELQDYFCPKEEGGLLSNKGVVDFSVAKGVAPGVFVIAEMRHPRVRERMSDLHLGPGPYYSFFRPYHLTSLEVPLSAAAAVLFGQSHMRPLPVPTAEVGCVAKRDLAVGETLDAIGEYGYRGFALSRVDSLARKALPIGLAQGATMTRPVRKGELITLADAAPDERLKIVEVRRAQEAMIAALGQGASA
ncbi:NAD(P)H-dependent oxidoreductase [Bosea lathyri]|uniref:Predicted homoserine dehydrogenase, contains C-terminal SAF domain n=1 Tax=Bosea lathyri TaxID=1036778 RepID=A0A1H5ZD31_9HYPH|nr:SAF domain-containing protein [Bosea lathyri]SEG34389.1 Predicted homoserine dehydrogenase, contains C-terminal SAF domain [Bosea lathyri]